MNGAYRARVTRIKANRPYVVIPRLSGELEYGPLDILQGLYSLETLDTESADGPDPHTHEVILGAGLALAAEDRVLVAFLEGRPDDPVILGRLV